MEQLGIEPQLLLAQLVNFAIIILVLTKLLYKPILAMLAKRKKAIEEGVALTEKLRLEEEKMHARREKLLADARKEGHVILEEARKLAKEEEKEIIADAHAQAEAIIEKGRQEVKRLKEELVKEMRQETVALGATMARRLLGRVLSIEDKRTIIEKHIKMLEDLKV